MVLGLHADLAGIHASLILGPIRDRQEYPATLQGEGRLQFTGPKANLLGDVRSRDHEAQRDLITADSQVRPNGSEPAELDADRNVA